MFNRPSLSTIGTKQSLLKNRDSRIFFDNAASAKLGFRGKCFFEGRLANITTTILLLPWSLWWQSLVMVTIIYGYVIYLLYAHYFTKASSIIDATLICCELIYLMDVIVHLLHAFWHIVRLHMRIYRRSYLSLSFDVLSFLPLTLLKNEEGLELVVTIGRWLGLLRIYRLYNFMKTINAHMHVSRKLVYLIEHVICVLLILHSASCFWYDVHRYLHTSRQWSTQGYPSHVGLKRLDYHSYKACWYYCTCRLFNVLFGDSFPLHSFDKWLTSCLMLLGYVVIRYRFIGIIAWEFVVTNSRRYKYVDRCRRMLNYLKLRGAPSWLVDQAKRYKETLWNKKDGVLTSEHLNRLPLPLRMELIFDINVDSLHKSLLFKHADESCLRQVSLQMRHELFLTGQNIWSQNIVKAGMICVKRGIIEMLSDEDDESPIIAFKEGTVLGELSLFFSIPSKVTIKAATYVELQVLRRTDFMRLMLEQPTWREKIRERISTRIGNIRQREEAIKEYDKGDSRLIRTRYRPMKVLKDRLANIAEEDSTFVDDTHLYYRDANNVKQKRFTSEYLELYQLAENVTMVDTPPICIRANFPWILEPDTNFTHMCDILHFAMVLYMCLVCPYDALLSDDISDLVKVLNTILMVGLLLNLYLQVTTAIPDKDDRKETVKEIAEVKMSTFGFYLDLLSVFPMWIFTDTLDAHGETIMKQIATLLPILQVWHLWSYISKWEENFKSNVKILCLVKFTLFVTILSYWSGCFLYFVACPRKLCKEGSWMALLVYIETKVFATIMAKHEEPVISSLNFGTSVFTGSGSVNISPGPDDLLLVNLLFVLGSYMSYLFTAKVCSLYILSTQRKLKFKESMRELFYFLSVNRVSEKIKSRVEKFFRVQWFNTIKVKESVLSVRKTVSMGNEPVTNRYYNHAVSAEELFSNLSDNMKQEVLCVEIVQILLYCPIFQECPRDFLQIVGSKTRTIVLPDNEIVQHAADIGRDMYILQKGYCDILNHMGKVVKTIGPGDNVGLLEMLYGLPKVYTVVTSTNCVLLHVEFSTLVQSWNIFPDVADIINQVLDDPLILNIAKRYENSKPLTSKAEVKANRLTQGIKESFILLNGRVYVNAFDKLGIMRYIRYIIVPISITPHGMFLKIWCALRILLAVYYIFVVPYDIAVKGSNIPCISNHWIDMVLYVDIVIMAYVGYYDERSLLVSHPLYTISHYLKHGFLVDLITAFPIEYLFKIINEESNTDPYRINKILQVTRIMGALSYWEGDIMSANQAIILIKFLPAAVTIANLSTVVLFSNTCQPITPANNSYFLEVNCTRTIIMGGSKYDIVYSVREYVDTFYWVFEIIVGCGCTPVAAMNSVDCWMIMVLQLLGFVYFAFMFGSVASSRSASARSLLDHNEKITDLANFLYQENVEPSLSAKTLEYFEYVWKRTNGNNPQQICRRLNSVLMEDTLVFMYERSLREVPLFGKVERSFIRVITRHLHEMYFLKGETVIQYKDVQPYIYIIYKGKVDVLSSYNEMITCMGPGGMFGNFSGSKSRSEVTVYASRSLDLLVIPSQDFFNLIKYYPKLKEPLNKAIQISKDYVLPISMDTNVSEDSSSDDVSADNSGDELRSVPSMNDSRSGSGRFYESSAAISLSLRNSQSNISQSKSAASQLTLHNDIHPYNLFRPGTWLFQIFGYFVCIMAVANYVLVSYELVTLNNCYVFSWFHTIFDIVFYVKIYIRIHQGYVNKRGCYIGEPARCRGEYFKSKLRVWTDILVNFPLEFFAFCFPEPATVMHFWRINKLFRLKYLWEFNSITSSQLTNNITSLQSAMTIFVVILMFHTFTCVWLLASILITPVSIIRTVKLHLIDEDTTPQLWDYTTSFYVVVSELSASGGDEFLVDDTFATTILAICLLFGKILASVIIATSVQVAYSSQNALVNYEKKTNQLIDVLKNQGLSSYQLKKLRKYIRQLWVSERGRQLPALLAQTPYVRRCDLMSAMFGHHLRNCFLFADTGQSFLRQLSALLEYNVYFPGNYIAVENDSEPKMFWVDFGTVAVVSVRSDLTEVTYELLGPGDVFGILQGMTKGLLHRFSYRAETKVNILSLTLDSWNDLLSFFPESKSVIMERAEVLYANI